MIVELVYEDVDLVLRDGGPIRNISAPFATFRAQHVLVVDPLLKNPSLNTT